MNNSTAVRLLGLFVCFWVFSPIASSKSPTKPTHQTMKKCVGKSRNALHELQRQLELAAANGDLDQVKALIDKGADIAADEYPVCRYSPYDSINRKKYMGETVLDAALFFGQRKVFDFLMAQKNVNLHAKVLMRSAVDGGLLPTKKSKEKPNNAADVKYMIETLIQKGVKLDQGGFDDQDTLVYVIRYYDSFLPETLEALMTSPEVTPVRAQEELNSGFKLAASGDALDVRIVDLLMGKGAVLKPGYLELAARGCNPALVGKLLDARISDAEETAESLTEEQIKSLKVQHREALKLKAKQIGPQLYHYEERIKRCEATLEAFRQWKEKNKAVENTNSEQSSSATVSDQPLSESTVEADIEEVQPEPDQQ